MKKILILPAFAATILAAQPAKADPVPLEALLKEIKVALLKVQQSSDAKEIPSLTSATLNATATQKKTVGGTFKLFIIEFGKKRTSELTTGVSIVLSPPNAASAADVSTASISVALSEAILSAARAIKAAKEGSPALRATEVKASIKFGVSQDSSGKISLEFLPTIAGGGEAGVSESTAQEIVIVYKS